MYTRSAFGAYYPVDSVIHSLNSVLKLINFLIVILLLFLTNSLYVVLFILMLVIIMILQSRVPLYNYFNAFYGLRYVYLILAFVCAYFNISFEGYLIYALKIIIFFEPWIMVLMVLAIVLPLIGLIYGGVQLIFGFKPPKWRPGLVIFVVWLVVLVVLAVLFALGAISTDYLSI